MFYHYNIRIEKIKNKPFDNIPPWRGIDNKPMGHYYPFRSVYTLRKGNKWSKVLLLNQEVIGASIRKRETFRVRLESPNLYKLPKIK